ncbi:MAG TPA: hypothetical protein VKG44_08435 [Candidatus Baltobacteraceae bacterium]|nr:hypothetical protein [Candidatus Baltobacteraceae bacterium]
MLLVCTAAFLSENAVGNAIPTPAIHDCASFRKWFAEQPGSRLTLTIRSASERQNPPTNGSDEFPIARIEATGFRGNVGGGGCLAGYYDALHHLVAVIERYDTAQDFVQSEVTSAPHGLRSGWVGAPTLNGAKLGMTLAQLERVEGSGLRERAGNDVVLAYMWQKHFGSPTNSPLFYSIKFLLHNDRTIAMDYFYGA